MIKAYENKMLADFKRSDKEARFKPRNPDTTPMFHRDLGWTTARKVLQYVGLMKPKDG